MAEIRSATFADALALADRLRFEDAREIAASWGVGPREGLFHCLLQSDRSFALIEKGEPDALWGVTGATEHGLAIGIPWMLAADRLFDGNRPVLDQSRRVIRQLLLDYDVLSNSTDAANDAHLRWLAWCGFRPLRRHEDHGAARRAFVEFYRVNEKRHASPRAVVAILERRKRPAALPAQPVRRLVEMAIGLLEGSMVLDAAAVAELVPLLGALERGAAIGVTVRRGCIALLMEVAVGLTGRRSRGGANRQRPVAELFDALAEVADLMAVDGRRDGAAAIVAALSPSGGPRPAADPREVPSGALPSRAEDVSGFQWLVRRHVRMLTVDGRLRRVQGYRLWAAAIGGAGGRVELPVDARDLRHLLHDHWLTDMLRGGAGAASALAVRRAALLARPVGHALTLARMHGCAGHGDAFGRSLRAQLDGWLVVHDDRSGTLPARIATLGDAFLAASAIADRAALQILPSLRLGGVVSGFPDRQWLFRLLRTRLLLATGECDAAELSLLLVDDVAGLLLARRLEDRLLTGPAETPAAGEVESLLREALSLWSPEAIDKGAVRHVLDLLLPAMAVPAAHEVQLAPAVLAWHLASTGRLEQALGEVADVLRDDGLGSRRRYRNVLRTLAADVDIVSLRSHLGANVDGEPASRHTSPFAGGR